MLIDEIRAGESANIEFKVEVPKKSESAGCENRTSGAVRGRELVTPSYSTFYIFMLRIEVESVRINKVCKQGIARIKGFLLS